MTRPTLGLTAEFSNLYLPDGLHVTWDRGVPYDDGSCILYGWIDRDHASGLNGRAHELLLLQFDATGAMIWWMTSSAAWSQKIWDFFDEPGEHIDCQPWRVALIVAGTTAAKLAAQAEGRITHMECGCPILGPHREGCPAAPPPPPPAYLDPGVSIKEGGRTDRRRPSGWGNQ